MNKIILCFCGIAFLACGKKEEPAEVNTYANYKVITVQNGGRVSGKVSRTDSVPYLEKVSIQRDQPVCGESHPNPSDPGPTGVRGCVVWIERITEGKAFDFGSSPKLEQRSCAFLPHVQVVQAGATMLVTNDD